MSHLANNTPPPQNEEKVEKEEIKRLGILMTISTNVATFVFLLVFSLYFINFGLKGVIYSTDKAEWGQFGDFIGGILNPTVAGLALFWLITSVNLQIKELKKTNEALTATVKTAKEQQNQISIQNFENLFFQLLSNLNNITNNIQAGSSSTFIRLVENQLKDRELKDSILNYVKKFSLPDNPAQKGKESIKDQIIFYKVFVNQPWEVFYNKAVDDYFGSYFRTTYQIIKLIDQNDFLKKLKDNKTDLFSKEQKKYFDIFRAQLSGYELEAIFFNCLSSHGNSKFKGLAEKYGLFEHILLDHDRVILFTDPNINTFNRLTMYAYKYEQQVFEKNKKWKEYFKDLSSITVDKYENIQKYLDLLISDNILNDNYFFRSGTYDMNLLHKRIVEIKSNHLNITKKLPLQNIFDRKRIKEERYFIENHTPDQITQYKSPSISEIRIQDLTNHIKLSVNKSITSRKKLNSYNSLDYFNELSIILKYKINFKEYCEYMQSPKDKEKSETLDNPTQQS